MGKNLRRSSQKRERQLAQDIGGRAHVLSGGAWNKKGDVSNSIFLVEDKFTLNSKYTIQDSVIKKLLHQSRDVNKLPIFSFGYVLNNKKVSFAVLREQDIQYTTKDIVNIPGVKKSWSVVVDFLEELYRNSLGRVFCRFTMESGVYVMMLWDDFVIVMEQIERGEVVL